MRIHRRSLQNLRGGTRFVLLYSRLVLVGTRRSSIRTESHAKNHVVAGGLCPALDGLECPNTDRVTRRIYLAQAAQTSVEWVDRIANVGKFKCDVQLNTARECIHFSKS